MTATTSSNIEHISLDVRGSGGPSNPPVRSQAISDPTRTPQASNIQAVAIPDPHGPPDGVPDPDPGDFLSSADPLWRLYEMKTTDRDKDRFLTQKYDMEHILMLISIFAVVLTAFIIDVKQKLRVNPQDQMVYYLQQNVAMLDQISQQISFIAPQSSITYTQPTPFPNFNPSASDLRVNVYWFMALIFMLSAAFLATLVRQSVHDSLGVFELHSDPLISARVRQYTDERFKRWCMPIVEAIPGILHVSLFLFFIGLCDFVFDANTTIGLTTTICIAIIGLLYIAVTTVQVISPRLPYRTAFSGIIRHVFQKFNDCRCKNGGPDRASNPLAQKQVELAMERTEGRERRDERAIRRLVSNMTDDTEIEALVMAIPGSFSGRWGSTVWNKVLSSEDMGKSTGQNEPSRIQRIFGSVICSVGRRIASDSRAQTTAPTPTPHLRNIHSHYVTPRFQGEDTVHMLSARVRQLLDTCKDRDLLANDGLWRRRTRACVETTALLVSYTGARIGQFGDMVRLLGDIGDDQEIRELSLEGRDDSESLVMHWTFLSLMAIQPILNSTSSLHDDARQASRGLERRDYRGETRLEKIIRALDNASSYLEPFAQLPVLDPGETEDRVKQILDGRKFQISKLEEIDIDDTELGLDDESINSVQQSVDRITHGVTRQLPGVKSDISHTKSDDISQFIELFHDPHNVLFILPLRNLRRIRSFAQTIRKILEGHDADDLRKFQKTIKDLGEIQFSRQWDNLFRRQMWRLQDLQDGGLGFIVELFFLALKQLLSKSSSRGPHSALYIGTFRAITTDWTESRDSLGTQKLLLDMVVPYRGLIFSFEYPPDIVTAFLVFLGNILQGQTGVHIDEVAEMLTSATREVIDPRYRALSTEALRCIRAAQSSS